MVRGGQGKSAAEVKRSAWLSMGSLVMAIVLVALWPETILEAVLLGLMVWLFGAVVTAVCLAFLWEKQFRGKGGALVASVAIVFSLFWFVAVPMLALTSYQRLRQRNVPESGAGASSKKK